MHTLFKHRNGVARNMSSSTKRKQKPVNLTVDVNNLDTRPDYMRGFYFFSGNENTNEDHLWQELVGRYFDEIPHMTPQQAQLRAGLIFHLEARTLNYFY